MMKRRSIALGAILVVLLVVLTQYLILPKWYRDRMMGIGGWGIMLSIAMGVFASFASVRYLIRSMIAGRLSKSGAVASRSSSVGAYVGATIISPFALYCGFILGGNFGGALGAGIPSFENLGAIVGIGLGLFIVTSALCAVCAFVGFLAGGLVSLVIK